MATDSVKKAFSKESISEEDDQLLYNAESSETKTKDGFCGNYPFSVFFIIGNEFCERFSFYGMRAVLVLYLVKWLSYSPDTATAIFHGSNILLYFTPIIGAVIADGYIGKYKTILYLSFVYACGNIVMAATSFPPPERIGVWIGLFLIGVGTGGIKPCVSAFGGDQFQQNQKQEQNQFFAVFYFAINLGSMISMILTPILRADVHCMGQKFCYPLAFGVPALLMLIALAIFIAGKNLYRKCPPSGNVIGQLFGCIFHSIKMKFRKGATSKNHWLDHAEGIYEVKFLDDVKKVLKVLTLYLPLPIFWALYDQQGSRWTLQATQLNGNLGVFGFLKPDQVQAINPILILMFIPLFESFIYPLSEKCGVPNNPLLRMVIGMLLASSAFVCAGFLQLEINKSLPTILKVGESHVKIINSSPCLLKISSPQYNFSLPSTKESPAIIVNDLTYNGTIQSKSHCANQFLPFSLSTKSQKMYLVVIALIKSKIKLHQFTYPSQKAKTGGAKISFLNIQPADYGEIYIKISRIGSNLDYFYNTTPFIASPFKEIQPGRYKVAYNDTKSSPEFHFKNPVVARSGAIDTILIEANSSNSQRLSLYAYSDVKPNSVSILLQIPQYILLTCGEIMFSVTGLQFSYSQAPANMKSVLQAAWLLTIAFGNVIVVIVAEARLIPNQATEFFVFAGLMFADIIIFSFLAYFYKLENFDSTNDDVNDLIDMSKEKESNINNQNYGGIEKDKIKKK